MKVFICRSPKADYKNGSGYQETLETAYKKIFKLTYLLPNYMPEYFPLPLTILKLRRSIRKPCSLYCDLHPKNVFLLEECPYSSMVAV